VTFEPVVGRYVQLRHDGMDFRVFFEEAGEGIPLLCLHTAGACSDSSADSWHPGC